MLPTNSAERKGVPICTGVLDYFPLALAAIARLSKIGNDKHNPGEPLHWAREKSTDHADCIIRHMLERGTIDDDGELHEVKVAWRALAQLQLAEEKRLAAKAKMPPVAVSRDEQFMNAAAGVAKLPMPSLEQVTAIQQGVPNLHEQLYALSQQAAAAEKAEHDFRRTHTAELDGPWQRDRTAG